MEALLSLVGAFVGTGLFMLGFWFGKEISKPKTIEPVEMSEEEKQKIMEEREQLMKEQEAFKELMSYNADIAYRVTGEDM